jgi:polysaccharide export outer membrane protein
MTGTPVRDVKKPIGSDAVLQKGAYQIGPGDVLSVDVWKEPDASTPPVTVRPDGKITLRMIGEIQVTGLTPSELESRLAAQYSQFIRAAQVSVVVREVNSQKVYVIGEVNKEGPVRIQGPITVLQTLAEAGGLTDYAKRRKIYVLRNENGKQTKLPFDYDAVVRGDKVTENIPLIAGDTIVVPR